jgi:small subunit ribosomal protein S24e
LKLRIVSRKQNPLLKRDEVIFEVDHSEEGETTSRSEMRRKLADVLKSKLELIFVEKAETKTGTMTAKGEANIYETIDQAKLIEREHIIQRNQLEEEPAEVEAPEKAAEVEAPEKAAEVEAPEKAAEVEAPEKAAEVEAPKSDSLKEEPGENLEPKEAGSGKLEPEEASKSEKESPKEELTENEAKGDAKKLEV